MGESSSRKRGRSGRRVKAMGTPPLGTEEESSLRKCSIRSGSDESSTLKMSFCIRGVTIDEDLSEWYSFTVSGDDLVEEEKRIISRQQHRHGGTGIGNGIAFCHDLRHEAEPHRVLRPIQVLEDRRETSWAVLGSTTIYCLGHRGRPSRKVLYFDVNHPDQGWKRAPSLLHSRSEAAKILTVEGKLYVFGGRGQLLSGGATDWAEVFDPEQCSGRGRWRALPPLPDDVIPRHEHQAVFVVADRGRIVMGSESSDDICEFDIGRQCWRSPTTAYELGSHLRPGCCYVTPPLLVGNTLYWLDKELNAYELESSTFYSGPIQDFSLVERLCLGYGFYP